FRNRIMMAKLLGRSHSRVELRLRSRSGLRQRNAEAASDSLFRLERDTATIDFDSPLCDGQTETGTAILAGACFINTVKTIEDTQPEVGRNARARIGYFDDSSVRCLSNRDFDLSA